MASVEIEPYLYSIKGLAILDNNGDRIFAKYFNKPFSSAKEEKQFEKTLFQRTWRCTHGEIILHEGLICTYRSNVDVYFYVMGGTDQNEIALNNVLNCMHEAVAVILKRNVEKRQVIDHMDVIMLAMDELCDQGIILETDASRVVERVMLRTEPDYTSLSEQSMGDIGYQVFKTAKEQVQWALLK